MDNFLSHFSSEIKIEINSKWWEQQFSIEINAHVANQQAHDVETTSIQHWLIVKTLNQRLINVVSTMCARWELQCQFETVCLKGNGYTFKGGKSV